MLEKDFQKWFIDQVKNKLAWSVSLKNDPRYIQGIPDWIVLSDKGVYIFEIKAHSKASKQPNQSYYIDKFNEMGYFSAFVCPENAQEVLDAI